MADSSEKDWAEKAKRLIKAELKRADVSYEELASRLAEMGLPETKASIASKLARGRYSALFLLAALRAIGRDTVAIGDM